MPAKSADEAIRQAMEEGKFDNLRGKGKPLQLDDNPHADPEWQMAHHLLKESGYSLPWIETRKALDDALAAARAALARAAAWRSAALAGGQSPAWVQGEWERAAAAFRQQAEALNRQIRAYNLQAPADAFHLRLVDANMEIEEQELIYCPKSELTG